MVSDPVGQGFVESLARPGGNITGFSAYDAPIMGKWLQLLKEAATGITRVAVIINPDTAPYSASFNRAIAAAAASFGVAVRLAPVRDDAGIEKGIAAQARQPSGGLICLPDSFNITHRDAIIAAAARHGLPLIGPELYPKAGGLMSYAGRRSRPAPRAASYIDRLLRGANPAELPVQQPAKYLLIINLKTARALGLTVSPAVLALADTVIE
jgi:putative tryptophan/tyrosine transport system substrate-binding protein